MIAKIEQEILKAFCKLLNPMLGLRRTGFIFAAHGVAKSFVDPQVEEVHINFDNFVDAIQVISELGISFVSMNELIDLSKKGFRANKSWCHLTFDDGYLNNFEVIYPYLKERCIPFSVFISTAHIQTGDRFPTFWLRAAEYCDLNLSEAFPDVSSGKGIAKRIFLQKLRFADYSEHLRVIRSVKRLFSQRDLVVLEKFINDKPMTLKVIQKMSKDPLVHIGSHSHEHIIFHDNQEFSVVSDQMLRSKNLISREWMLTPSPTFCWPNGDWAPKWVKLASNVGFPLAFASHSGFVDENVNPMILPRFWLRSGGRIAALAALSILGNRALICLGRRQSKFMNLKG